MLLYEWLIGGYFIAFAVVVSVSPGAHRPTRAAAASAAMAGTVTLAAALLPLAARLWLAHLYLVTAYWIPALATRRNDGGAFEQWLVAGDVTWQHRLNRIPRWLGLAGELSYLFCYPFVPAAFAVVWLTGTAADADRFWIAVLIAGFACYWSLPWLTARPPRLLSAERPAGQRVAGLNATILARLSHGRTTFPSGHVAVSTAAAMSLIPVSLPFALLFAGVAGGIALGAATGRYHYVVDVVTGVAVGLLAPLVAALV